MCLSKLSNFSGLGFGTDLICNEYVRPSTIGNIKEKAATMSERTEQNTCDHNYASLNYKA